MDDDLDKALARLSRQPVPGALAQTESTVLERIASFGPRLREVPLRIWVVAIVFALSIGIAGGAALAPRADPPLFPLTPSSRLAPSTLLVG